MKMSSNSEMLLSEEIKNLLDSVKIKDRDKKEYIDALYALMCAYESEDNSEKASEVARELRSMAGNEYISEKYLRTCYDVLARSGDFEAFMISMEWNRPLNKKFYLPRAKVFRKHGIVQSFQDLADDKLDFLIFNCPPRIGKSTLSMFFLLFRAARHPEQSILGSGHSTALTQSFYREFLEMATSDEYRFNEIFPKIQLTQQNAEYTYIDFNQNKRFHTVTFKSVEGGTTGLTEASSLLYCDDLIKDAETANSKDRLDKLFESYTSTLKDRKVMRLCKDGVYRPCPELHVCTNWSIYDPTTRILNDVKQYGDMSRVRVIKVPCWDEDHESNYMYDYGKGFDVKYYEDMERVEDPVIFKAKYLCEPIERDGHPFERDALTYYTELPNETPDAIVAYNDVAHGGEDFMSMPIGYVYGRDVYIEDVLFIHNFDGDTVSRPLVCEKIISNNVSRCGFEKNNGGDFYSTLISEDLRKMGYRCNIMSYNAPTTKSKLDRILSCQNEIKGVASLDGSYRIYFKDPKLVSKNSDYMAFLTNMWSWSQKEGAIQKKQHDDSVDSISSLIINLLGKGSDSAKLKLYDIRKAGY